MFGVFSVFDVFGVFGVFCVLDVLDVRARHLALANTQVNTTDEHTDMSTQVNEDDEGAVALVVR